VKVVEIKKKKSKTSTTSTTTTTPSIPTPTPSVPVPQPQKQVPPKQLPMTIKIKSSDIQNVAQQNFQMQQQQKTPQKKQNQTAMEEMEEEEVQPASPSASRRVLSRTVLESNRVSTADMLRDPKFQGYTAGTPSNILYIKNLEKNVDTPDLQFIFGRYFPSDEEVKKMEIKLMKEGKMKGQAFITLPSIDLTIQAVKETHGYKLFGKPMIVQYGKGSKK